MPRVAKAAPKKRAAPKNHKLAEQFAKDTVLTDILKKKWRLGDVIGQGGFGLVYLASSPDSTSNNAQYVIKIEPGSNGPLFCEMNFYIRAAKINFIHEFIKSHKLKYLAVPPYIGSGLHNYNSVTYRFLVMPRYGTDLQKLLKTSGGTFPTAAVYAIGLRMIDALEYLHEKEYVHADVKAANILLGFNGHSENRNEVYLADYGLAYRYTANDEHKEYKVDPRSAHNGTLEFTSRDAHRGVFPSRRGDMEILGFCMLQWMCGKLPWDSNLTDPNWVAKEKEEFMEDVSSHIKACFPGPAASSSDCLKQYLQEVGHLDYDEKPNYKKLKDFLKSGLSKAGEKDEWKINFSTESKATKRRSQGAASPRVSPKKPRMADKDGSKASPARKRAEAASPLKRQRAAPKKSPQVNGTSKKSSIILPVATVTKSRTSAKAATPRPRFDASKPQKSIQIPPPSKPSPRKSPATPRQKAASSTVRRVRRTHASQSDASIQTTPGLKNNL